MKARPLSDYAEIAPLLMLRDSTTSEGPDWVRRHFETPMADVTTGVWFVLPMGQRRKRRLPSPATATEPSETSVLPQALDVTEDRGDDMAALQIAAGMGAELAKMAHLLAPPRVVRANLPPAPIELDVEREVIAHLPPKHVFETTLRVRYGGRARPNITLEMTQDGIWEA